MRASRFWSSLRRILRRRAAEQSIDQELASYLQHDVDSKIAAGMSPDEARRAAALEMGGFEQVKEEVRQNRAGAWLDSFVKDLAYACRTLRQAPGFSLAVIGSLSIGIAATVAAFAFINAVIAHVPPGVAEPGRLVLLVTWRPTSYSDFVTLKTESKTLTDLAAFVPVNLAVSVTAEPRVVHGMLASQNYFDVLGVRPTIGRTFAPDEAQVGTSAVAVISHAMWVRDFNSNASAIGATVRVANQMVRVIGVAPPDFAGAGVSIGSPSPDIWLPATLSGLVSNAGSSWPEGMIYVGRLRQGVTMPEARAEAEILVGRFGAAGPNSRGSGRVEVRGISRLKPVEAVALSGLVMSMPIVVLLIACMNSANLVLARGSARASEIAVRLAIGAGRLRIVRQLLVENLLLAIAATAVAWPLAWYGVHLAQPYLFLPMPFDGMVFLLALLTAGVTAIGFGLAPALRVTETFGAGPLASRSRAGVSPREARGRQWLIVVQVALSLGLLVTGTQLVSAVRSLGGTAGTPQDRLLLASFDLDQLKLSAAEADVFYRDVLDGVSRLRQTEAVGLAHWTMFWKFGPPGKAKGNSVVVWRPEDAPKEGRVHLGGYAGGEIFSALGLRVLKGRTFNAGDRTGQPRAAVVNQAFAEEVFQGEPLGRVLRVAAFNSGGYPSSIEIQVVGVVDPVMDPSYNRGRGPLPAIYLPSPLEPQPALALYVRSRGPLDELATAVRQVVRETDPRVPLLELASLQQVNERDVLPLVGLARAAGVIGYLSLVLATAGLYALVSYGVSRRSREFAVRMALGAQPGTLLAMVLKQAMKLAVIGTIIGSFAAFAISQWIQAEFYTGRMDAAAFARSAGLLAATMLLASSIPAVRAARLDPVINLKET